MPFTRWIRGATMIAAVAALGSCSATPPTAPDAEPLPPSPFDGSGGSNGGGDGAGGPAGATGRFGGLAGHSASGGVTFRMGDAGGELIFGEDFRSSPVPDPHVYVATEPDANRGDRLRIAPLHRSSGAQQYAFRLPEGSSYAYVLVWCDRYNVGVGAARLGSAPSETPAAGNLR